jgi:eukaryotic-like serine/threonine-protein kinase
VPSLAPKRNDDGDDGDDVAVARESRLGSTSAVVPVLGHHSAPGVIVEQKYELVRLLGEGGMGAVWVAKHLTLDVHVALKIMHSELARQMPGAADRMLQEARAAACIGHPAIVQVFDYGRTKDGDPFISMELLHGESLAQALTRRGRLPAARALQVLLPIADALAVAHQRGIVHRDLKPDNVFLARLADGRVQPKVLDFGVAKLETATSPKLTMQGTVLGSPAYMAPEQAWGENDIDQRADVWAFAVMLYELLTGDTPFHGDSYNALLFAITRDEPKSIVEHGVNEPELWDLINRCLAKDRDQRFADMRELGRALAEWLLARGVKTDITKAPLGAWIDRRPPGFEASLFPSFSPHESSEPPLRIAVTQVGSPAPPAQMPVETLEPGEGPDQDPREKAAAKGVAMRTTPLLRGAVLRFSQPRKRSPVGGAVNEASPSERSRTAQFVGIAALSCLVFVAAAYFQSRRSEPHAQPMSTRATAPAPATPAPLPAEARTPADPALAARDQAVLASSEGDREGDREGVAEARREKPRPVGRARPRKRAASSDLKNPFD